jgi:flotillin
MSYRIARPDEYLAITGMGIKSVHITKAAWVWPFQRCMRFSVKPHDFAMNMQAMTKEKLQFLLPVIFTVGPDVNARGANARWGSDDHDEPTEPGGLAAGASVREDRGDALVKYAMLLAESSEEGRNSERAFLEGIVKGIIEGETRVLVSAMTMEEIFTERDEFKKRIFRNIQGELSQFGLRIFNANVKELKDAPGSIYFESLSRKAHEGATNQAKIDVAEAQLRGTVGEQERKGQMDREIARINAQTAVQKTERDIERAAAEALLHTKEAELQRDVEIARTQAKRMHESRDEDLKRDVEIKRAAAEIERLRATDVVKASIQRESKQQAADAAAYEIQADAKARYEKAQREADAQAYKIKTNADAAAYAASKSAEADLTKKLKEAEGVAAMADAYSKLAGAFGGPSGLLQYMMIEKGTYIELAKANAGAVHGMQPKISVWTTGAQGEDAGGAGGSGQPGVDTMRNVYQMLPPLMTTIHDQTGITLPEWQFGRMAATQNEVAKAQTNGKQ